MPAVSTTPQTLDSTRAYTLTCKKQDGTAYAFAGTEAITASITNRDGGMSLASPTVAFVTPSAGTLLLTVKATDIAALDPGTYGLEVTSTPASGTYAGQPLSAWAGTIALEGPFSRAATPGWTVRKLERLLIAKRRGWMGSCDMDIAASGSNDDTAGPIASAVAFAGGAVSDPTRPVDGDLASVDPAAWPGVLDVADYLLVEATIGNWDSYTLSYGTAKADYNDLSTRMRQEAERLLTKLGKMYGYGLSTPTIGVTDLDFQQGDPCDEWACP